MTNKNTYKAKRIGWKMPVNTLPHITVENEHTFTPEQVAKFLRQENVRYEKVEQMYDKCYLLGHGEDSNTGIVTLFDEKDPDWEYIVWAMGLQNTDSAAHPAFSAMLKWLCDGSQIVVMPDGEYDIIDNSTRFPVNAGADCTSNPPARER